MKSHLMGMNGAEIAAFLRRSRATNSSFQGVFPVDRLPHFVGYPCSIIINSDPASGAGGHWLAVYIDSFQVGYYFDSYGRRPTDVRVVNFLNSKTVKWRHNRKRIQGPLSTKCGNFCVYFLHEIARGISPSRVLFFFSSYLFYRNDLIVSRWYRHNASYVLPPWR